MRAPAADVDAQLQSDWATLPHVLRVELKAHGDEVLSPELVSFLFAAGMKWTRWLDSGESCESWRLSPTARTFVQMTRLD